MQVYLMLSLIGAVSFSASLKIPVAKPLIVTPLCYASTPGEQAVGVYRSASYQEHTVQIMKLTNWEETMLFLKKLRICPWNLILE